jgi:hypothetical protein
MILLPVMPRRIRAARQRQHKPQRCEQGPDDARDHGGCRARLHVARHQQHRSRDVERNGDDAADRHDVGRTYQAADLMPAEKQPVVRDGCHEEGDRDARQSDNRQIQPALPGFQLAEADGEGQREEKPEEDLDPEGRHPQFLQQISEIAVGLLLRCLARSAGCCHKDSARG